MLVKFFKPLFTTNLTSKLIPIQMLSRVPKYLLKVLHLVVFHFNAFRAEQIFHHRAATKIVFSGKHTHSVYHAVGGNIASQAVFHGVTHHTAAAGRPQKTRYGTITAHPAVGYVPRYRINPLVKITGQVETLYK